MDLSWVWRAFLSALLTSRKLLTVRVVDAQAMIGIVNASTKVGKERNRRRELPRAYLRSLREGLRPISQCA